MELKYIDETKEEFRKACMDLTPEDLSFVKANLGLLLNYLEHVQRLPLVLRLKYFNAVFPVYDFLRRNHQLGRRQGSFDAEVMEVVRNILL